MMTSLAAGAVIIGVILVFWFLSKGKPRKEVLFLRPRDKRGEIMMVTKETDTALICGRTNPVHRFIKVGPGYEFSGGGKLTTKFFGIEGTAYTAIHVGDEETKVSVPEFLEVAWGKKVYKMLPKKLRNIVEKDNFGIIIETVNIKEEESGLPTLTADDVNDEGDSIVLSRLAQAQKQDTKQQMYQLLIGVLLGLGLMAIMQNLGWI